MPPRVFEVRDKDRDKLAHDLADDRISRLSVWVREARHFGLDRDTTFVVLDGYEGVLLDAETRILAYGRVPEEAERVLGWVKWEDEASAYGIGRVFGEVQDVPPAPPRKKEPAVRRFWEWLKK